MRIGILRESKLEISNIESLVIFKTLSEKKIAFET